MVQAERFVSHLPLYRPQKRANEVRPYGRQNKPLQRYRAAVAAAVRRGRRTLQVTPNRLQISIHQPVLSYYAALYMQKVPADIAVGTFCCFIKCIKVPASCCLSPSEPWQAFQGLQGRPLWLPWKEPLFFREVPHTSVPSSCRSGHRRASGRC